MRVAVVGSGFSGMAAAWNLLQRPEVSELTIFDQKEIGEGTSGIAAGLLHYYVGAHAKLNHFGKEGWQATRELLEVASQALGKPVAAQTGMLRVALTADQVENFSASAAMYEDLALWNQEQCLQKIPYMKAQLGLFIPSTMTVVSNLYLKGLWKACQTKGANFVCKTIYDLAELAKYDLVILATGEGNRSLLDLQAYHLNEIKGQLLELEWPSNLPPLPFPINSHLYIIMSPDQKTCIVGSTFERNFSDYQVDLKTATREILTKLETFVPILANQPIVNAYAGLRISAKKHLPLCQKIKEKVWLLTGMGSKGLLYHALYARKLSEQIFND